MPEIIISGVTIQFPYEPYDVQRAYMEKVIECLQRGVNGVLESPTGTGKTLSLLCSSLGWLIVKKAQLQLLARDTLVFPDGSSISGGQGPSKLAKNLENSAGVNPQAVSWGSPKIIYASRTHTQLSQALSELKRTGYAGVIRSAVIGSRDQLCIHPEVAREPNHSTKIHMCQRYTAARSCYFHNNVETKKDHPDFTQSGIMDIEDLVRAGNKQRCCPYFVARELKGQADIIFMPYNYLLDPKMRKANHIELENCVVILDEAHNIEKVCEESASLQFRSTDIALCIEEVTKVMQDLVAHTESNGFSTELSSAAVKDFSQDDLCIMKTMFLELEKSVDEIPMGSAPEGTTFDGSYMFDILAKAGITQSKKSVILDLVDKLTQYLTTSSTSVFARQGTGLQKFSELVTVVFSNDKASHMHSIKMCYKVHVTLEDSKNKNKKADNWLTKKTDPTNNGRTLNYWCFSSSFGMQLLLQQGARCVLLTSGTLSPIPALVSELGINIPVRLENGHVVDPAQVWAGVISAGPDGTALNSSFNTRNDPKYIASLGRTIQNFSRIVPGGLLVFFPSYPLLKNCQEKWQSMGIWAKISEQKGIFVESQNRESFTNSMVDYYDRVQSAESKGACFLAVCRGKVSEGLDFSDNNGRAVIITGLPYPPFKDPRVLLKQKYLDDSRTRDPEALTGKLWYQLEASRAVNQAIGRVIRHRWDYGAILLCDCRFSNPSFKQQLSSWLQPFLKPFTNFGTSYKGVIDFFKSAESTLPLCKTKNPGPKRPLAIHGGEDMGGSSRSQVSASFDAAKSRMVIRVPAADVLSTSQIQNQVNTTASPSTAAAIWTPSPLSEKRPAKRKLQNIDLFSALSSAEPTQVINFNEAVKMDMNLPLFTRGEKGPSAPRRKLVLSSTNTAIAGTSSTNKTAASSRSLASGRSASSSSLQPSKSTSSSSTSDKIENIAIYWKEVKECLDPVAYKMFIAIVKSYNAEGDFGVLVEGLVLLFLKQNQAPHLFKGFSRFIKTHHKEEFQIRCMSL